jgi:hypothetical protein
MARHAASAPRLRLPSLAVAKAICPSTLARPEGTELNSGYSSSSQVSASRMVDHLPLK